METQLTYQQDPKKHRRLSDRQLLYLLIIFTVTFGLVSLLDRFSDGEIPGVVHLAPASPLSGNILPPAIGATGDVWQNCGIYRQPVANENALHTLAHGAIWVTYQPEPEAAAVHSLENLLRGEKYVLLSPYPDQTSPIVVTAWGVQLELSSVTDTRLMQFIARYRLSAHAPESGASCVGGIGEPVR